MSKQGVTGLNMPLLGMIRQHLIISYIFPA